MSDLSLEQRIAGLEAKVHEIEEQLRLIQPRKASLLWSDRPPLSPEEQAAHDEVQRYMREAREAELAEFDREMERERGSSSEGL
jgi:hypothetical protein